jgi:hypothetical protein
MTTEDKPDQPDARAIEIIKKHSLNPNADYTDSWVLKAMGEYAQSELSAVKEENKQLREALAICERAESTPLEPVKSEWISVKDKLPEFTEPLIGCNDDNTPKVIIENYHVTVLAFDPEIGIFKAKLTKFGWSEIGKSYINGTVNVTHWQPLPSPPIE